jgi:hypothetical protein
MDAEEIKKLIKRARKLSKRTSMVSQCSDCQGYSLMLPDGARACECESAPCEKVDPK